MTDPFDFGRPPALYAVMGNPVSHSKSPQIHLQFAAQFGLRIEYRRIQVDLGGFAQAVSSFRANGGQGLNITVPFKLEAFELCDRHSDRAAQAGAVNTIAFHGQGLYGDNTDGAGLRRDITQNLGCALRGRRVLVLGAGGAVRGVLGPLLEEAPAALVIANRTVDKAVALARLFADRAQITASGFAALAGHSFDVMINGTAASLEGELPPLPEGMFAAGALAYDMMYGDTPTVFMRWAEAHGASQVADGLGMLVEQAAESFELWHGRRPATAGGMDSLLGHAAGASEQPVPPGH